MKFYTFLILLFSNVYFSWAQENKSYDEVIEVMSHANSLLPPITEKCALEAKFEFCENPSVSSNEILSIDIWGRPLR
jgi:hypothetical protein